LAEPCHLLEEPQEDPGLARTLWIAHAALRLQKLVDDDAHVSVVGLDYTAAVLHRRQQA
jgi:hypothetical protein